MNDIIKCLKETKDNISLTIREKDAINAAIIIFQKLAEISMDISIFEKDFHYLYRDTGDRPKRCERCGLFFENPEDAIATKDHQFCTKEPACVYEWLCERCCTYFNSDEYIADLKDKEGESRFEQQTGR